MILFALRLFVTVFAIALIVEKNWYGVSLTAIGLTIIFGIATGLLSLISGFSVFQKKHFKLVYSGCYFAVYFLIIHWAVFGRFSSNGTMYLGFTPLVLEGSITLLGYLYSLGISFIFAIATVFFIRPLGGKDGTSQL